MSSSSNSIDCSLKAYANNFAAEMNQCLKNNPVLFGEAESYCLVRSALETLKNMNARCSERQGTTNCTPKGYGDAVIEELDPSKKVLKIGFGEVKKIAKKLPPEIKNKLPPEVIAPPVELFYLEAAGCALGGLIGGIGGAAATPALPVLGGGIGLVQGCKRGMQIGFGVYGLWKVIVKVKGVYQATETTIKAVANHSKACEAKPLLQLPKSTPSSSILSNPPSKTVTKVTPQEKIQPVRNSEPSIKNVPITKPVPAQNQALKSAPVPVPVAEPAPMKNPLPELEWIDMETAAQKIVEFAGDLTGVTSSIQQIKELKSLFVNILSDPSNGPQLLVNELIKEPEKIFQKIITSPKAFIANTEAFVNDPTLAGALGIVGTAFSVVSLANEILPVITLISRKGIKNPAQLPAILSKELVKMTFSKIIAVAKLAQGLIHDPFKTGKQLINGYIKSPKILCRNVKNLFGHDKRKAKRKAKKYKRMQEAYNRQVHLENERQKQAIIEAVPVCYKAARHQWMIDEACTPLDVYFNRLVIDWKNALNSKKFQADFISFLQNINVHFNQGHFSEIVRLSPSAHLKEPTPPAIVSLAITLLAQTSLQLACEVKSLEREIVQHKSAALSLSNSITNYEMENKKVSVSITSGKTKEQLAKQLRIGLEDSAKKEACKALLGIIN